MLPKSALVDCLHKKRLPREDALLLILSVEFDTPKKVTTIKRIGRNAGLTEIQKWNVSDVLSRAKGLAIRIPEGWILTSQGWDKVRNLGVLPEQKSQKIVSLATSLRTATKSISNVDSAEFLDEAITSFEAGLYRAATVLSWVGAMSLIYDYVIQHQLSVFNAEAMARDAKWKPAKTRDDLCRMKESDFLDIIGSPPVSILGKNVKEELKNDCLRLRNACGHPNSLKIGENKVAAHLEILILNIFKIFI